MFKTGDDDLLRVGLEFYRRLSKMRHAYTKLKLGIEGAVYPECLTVLGFDCGGGQPHLTYHYTSCIEFALMMLEYGRYTGADITEYLPVAEGIITYYDQFYRRENRKNTGKELDDNGRLVIYPSNALELYQGARNNTDVLAGLMVLADALIALPEGMLTAERRDFYRNFRQRLAPLPTCVKRRHRVLAPAESWDKELCPGNMEFPQLYAVYPFGIYGLGKPDLDLARNTWWYGYKNEYHQKNHICWYQGGIFTARLGLTSEAKKYALAKFLQPSRRFPAFWANPGFCQCPDFDHGGSAMIGLQEMLLQVDGKKIFLLPAWPKDWNVDFKLHAPYKTTVEGRVESGKIVKLVVTPASRTADVVDMSAVSEPPPPPDRPVPLSKGKPAKASNCWSPDYGPDNAFDGNELSRWSAAKDSRNGWLEVDLGQDTLIGRAIIMEVTSPGIQEFTIEYLDGGVWKELARGTTIGDQKDLDFAPVRARHVRLKILKSKDVPMIDEFQLFAPETMKE